MDEPDFVLTPEPGKPSRVTLAVRGEPWLVRIGAHEILIAVVPSGGVADPGPEVVE